MVHCAKLLLKSPGWQWQPQLHRWGLGMENDFIPHSCLHSIGRNWYMPQRPESSNSNMFYNSQWIFSISVSRVFRMDILARRNELWPLSSSTTSCGLLQHYNDVTMAATASLITSLTIVYSTVYSSADQRKHQSSASLAFVQGIHRRPVNSPHKWPVTRKMFPFDDVIMNYSRNC